MAEQKRAAGKGGFWSRARLPGAGDERGELDYIKVRIAPLSEIFSGEYRYTLTCFQRAYSWQGKQVTRLLSDIREAMAQPPGRRRYCLGRLMLAKPPGKYETELVDGHQRLMTLTILFAVLRDLEIDEERRQWLQSFVAAKATQPKSKPLYLLSGQSTPSLFFETLVQKPGATEEILDVELHELSEAERNIYDNRETFRAELTGPDMDDAARRELADFLAESCHVIATIVEDQDQAWELVHIEQETRLDFTEADQAKAILLSSMPQEDRIPCSRRWEGCEAVLNSSDMYRLLWNIGAMKWRCRVQPGHRIENDVIAHFALEAGGHAFMDQEYVPNSERLGAIRRQGIGAEGKERASIAASIGYMNWIDFNTWVPAALKWLGVRGEDNPETELFFRRLERLVWMMKIAGEDPSVQETRIFDLNDEIGNWIKVDGMNRLMIEPKMLTAAVGNLNSPNFAAKHYSGMVLRRLSILMGADSGPITRDKVTVEHVLPRNPPQHGEWRRLFRTEGDVKEHAQRLGNLTLLTGPQNQKAGTFDWAVKRPVLQGSGFVLSKRAAAESDWTAKTILRRSDELIGLLLKSWDLKA